MAIKRKFESESVESIRSAKQLRRIPFPAYEPDTDVTMSDGSSDSEITTVEQYHIRHDSGSSTNSNISNSASYPSFNIYPNPFFGGPGGTVDTNSHNFSRYTSPPPQLPQRAVGLLEPKNSFAHHGHHLYTLGPSPAFALKFRSSALRARLVPMARGRCGVTANNAAPLK
ncbi:hypothetical protein EW146_g644 [Bondarzewia mesenterica]|uniref:Uncharacterized protein n=1 Tax=Bondarzewia mesenterica TaxID=1095465 RepID=A0A4S4M6M2_9AGAM|nr:hypothetical protein EW146_g644 [Bondarzewia mesenterica]